MFIKIIKIFDVKLVFPCLLGFLYLILSTTSYGAQENSVMPSNANAPIVKDEFEWQFMAELSLVDTQELIAGIKQTEPWDYFRLGLLLDISYKGFFIQSNSRRSSTAIGGELGYQITVQDDWQLDVLLKTYLNGFTPAEIIKNQKKNIPHLSGLDERDPIGGIALRYSHFFNDAVFYIDLASGRAYDSELKKFTSGLIVDSFYSYLLPYRNWDIYFGAGLTYYEQALMDYYIGVDPNEVTNSRPLYEADSTFRAQVEVYAQYPLSQSWYFNAGITQSFYSSNIKESPLVNKNILTDVMVGVLYVF